MPNANVIFRGPIQREPLTVSDRLVAGALLPGTIVTEDGTDFVVATIGALIGRLLVLTNRRFYNQGPDDAYLDNDTGVAYVIEPGQFYSALADIATHTKGDQLTTTAAGILTQAGAADRVIAEVVTTEVLAGIARIDVVMVDSYIAA